MRATIAALALAAAACGATGDGNGQWLTDPGYAGHAKYFPLVGTVHDAPITCDSCHGAFTTFKQFDCVTCHNSRPLTPDVIHVGVVAGYASPPYSDECLRCHPTGASIMADHGRFFPIGAGTKHNLACSQCHTDPRARSDLSKQQCNVCHGATDPNLATAHAKSAIGKDYTSSAACGGAAATTCPQACLRCHADGLLTTVAGHPSMRIPHEGATCFVCHDAPLRTDLVASPVAPSTTPQQYAADFKGDPRSCTKFAAKQGCYNCHTQCPP